MLNRSTILIAEDEPFIALDLSLAVEDAGGEVVGPASSAKEALALLETHTVVAAILDVNLIDGDISPGMEYLIEHHVPFVVQTGVDPPNEMTSRFPNLIVRTKPTVAVQLVAELETLLNAHGQRHAGDKSNED